MIALLVLVLQGADLPEAKPRPWRDVEIAIGGYFAAMETDLDVRTDSGLGAVINFEKLLGLDEVGLSARLGASVALAPRHRLHLDMFDLTREGTKQVDQSFTFNGTTYPANSEVDTTLGIQFINLTYGYSFMLDDRFNLAVTLGIHGLRTVAKIESEALEIAENERFFLPIPLPGLRMDFALTPDLWLRQRVELIWLSIDNYQGLVTDVSMSFEFTLFDHVALGVGWNVVRSKLKMDDDEFPGVKFRGEFEFDFAGLQLYLNIFF